MRVAPILRLEDESRRLYVELRVQLLERKRDVIRRSYKELDSVKS